VILWVRSLKNALSIEMINGLEQRIMLKIPATTSWVSREEIRTPPRRLWHAWKGIYGKESDLKSTLWRKAFVREKKGQPRLVV